MSTLKDYLLLAPTFLPTFLPSISELSGWTANSTSTATHCFDPGVHLNRQHLPFLVVKDADLFSKMFYDFAEVLEMFMAIN
jgi:hypothetical protein